jgi:hypothetical protein
MREIDHLLTDVEGVLETERNLLRNGAFDGLPQLALRKEQLIERIADHPDAATVALLERVMSKAQANLALFVAAQNGLRTAQERLDQIRNLASTLQTYDNTGRTRAFSTPIVRHERRA